MLAEAQRTQSMNGLNFGEALMKNGIARTVNGLTLRRGNQKNYQCPSGFISG